MGKFGKKVQKTLYKVQDKFAPGHNGYVKLEDKDVVPSDVPKGSFVVYVGDEKHQFVIQTKILNHDLFQAVLEMSAKEFGYNPNGVIIDCDVQFFKRLVRYIVLERQNAARFFGLHNYKTIYGTYWMD